MKPTVKKFIPILETILKQAMTEEELYQSYFRKECWSVEEFMCLMVGITPKRYNNVLEGNSATSPTDMKKCSKANSLAQHLLQLAREQPRAKYLHLNLNLTMTAWKFIRLIAMNEIPLRFGFFKNLPLNLKEIYLEFQPINVILRIKSKFAEEYHRAFYKHEVEWLLEINPDLTPKEIYSHPHMLEVRKAFKDRAGKHVHYANRTIKAWIAKVKKSGVGRPKKRTK